MLPAAYVAEHLALATPPPCTPRRASTVDTTHTVVTVADRRWPRSTSGCPAAATPTPPTSPPSPRSTTRPRAPSAHQLHRDPVAVLAGLLDDRRPDRRPLRAGDRHRVRRRRPAACAPPAELLADAAQLAATERTAGWLDQLTDDGALTAEQRARIAAEDGAAVADPDPAPRRARRPRPPPGPRRRGRRPARSTGREPHQRALRAASPTAAPPLRPGRRHLGRLDPAHRQPGVARYLAALAAAADQRAAELGRDAADEPPAWAVEALGPVPDDRDRARRVGAAAPASSPPTASCAATTTPTDALGAGPEARAGRGYAAYRAAWRALGPPGGRPRRAASCPTASCGCGSAPGSGSRPWAPRYVGNELAGTRQAAAHHRQTAALRRAEADAATDAADRRAGCTGRPPRPRPSPTPSTSAPPQLQQLDDARARWLAHTAGTRAAAERAEAVLAERHADDAEPEPVVTAEEWLAAHRAADAEDERHREITEADLAAATGDDATRSDARRATAATSRRRSKPARPTSARSPRPSRARSPRTSCGCPPRRRDRRPHAGRPSARSPRSAPATAEDDQPRRAGPRRPARPLARRRPGRPTSTPTSWPTPTTLTTLTSVSRRLSREVSWPRRRSPAPAARRQRRRARRAATPTAASPRSPRTTPAGARPGPGAAAPSCSAARYSASISSS